MDEPLDQCIATCLLGPFKGIIGEKLERDHGNRRHRALELKSSPTRLKSSLSSERGALPLPSDRDNQLGKANTRRDR